MATADPTHQEPSFFSRLRAGSHSLKDKVRRSPSRGSEGGHGARGSVSNALAKAGALSGTIGSPFLDPDQQQREDVKSGAQVLLQELERVASRSIAEPSIERSGTIQVEPPTALIEADTENPIVTADENPFEVKDDAASDKSYDFTHHIRVLNDDSELAMRALLDTGMTMNAISLEKAEKSGFAICEYHGPLIKDAQGDPFAPRGKVELQFYFKGRWSAKTWALEFVVLEDPPFDVALGSIFIKHAGLLKPSDVALPMAFSPQTPKDRREQDIKTQERNSANGQVKDDQQRRMDARLEAERERKRKEREKEKDKKNRR